MISRPPSTPPLTPSTPVTHPDRGHIRGTAVVGGFEWFIKRFGNAAAHEVVNRVSPRTRAFLQPNAPVMGLLGTRIYPYAAIGEVGRTMLAVSHMSEDAFLREMAAAAMEASFTTIHRIAVRYLTSLQSLAAKAPEMWDLFHDCGHLSVLSCTDHEYVTQVSDWPSHDVMICRLTMEARRQLVVRTGIRNPELFRDKCQAWGHDVCTSRIRWT